MGIAPYAKVHRTPSQCVAHLVSRGLGVANSVQAERTLVEVGQDRLRPYCLARRDVSIIPAKPFLPNISFSDIVELYNFDEELRTYLFRYCAKIEIIFKNSIAEVLSENFGPHPYFNNAVYNSAGSKLKGISQISMIISKKLESDVVAKRYYEKHDEPAMPPIWTTKEFLTFGAANYYLENLENGIRNKVARRVGLPDYTVLKNWIKCIIDLRNICAHHGRLFNRKLQKSPQVFRRVGIPSVTNINSVAAVIECMEFIVRHFDISHTICDDVKAMVARYPSVSLAEIGF